MGSDLLDRLAEKIAANSQEMKSLGAKYDSRRQAQGPTIRSLVESSKTLKALVDSLVKPSLRLKSMQSKILNSGRYRSLKADVDRAFKNLRIEIPKDLGPRFARKCGAACEWRYRATRNPTFAWSTYRRYRSADVAVPDWVLEYFDQCADRMYELERNPPPKNVGGAVAKALGMNRRGPSIFSQFSKDMEQAELALNVGHMISKIGKPYLAWQIVADQKGLSVKAVRDAHNKFKAHLGDW